MPFVNIKLAGEVDKKQKEALAEKVTQVITEVTGKPAQYTYIVIEEVPREDWAIGGKLLG